MRPTHAHSLSSQSSSESDSEHLHISTSINSNPMGSTSLDSRSYNRSFTSSRMIDCSLRVYRQALPLCIPEHEPISFGRDDMDEHDEAASSSNNNISDFLFCSPKGRSPTALQTVKQQPRIYPKTISRLLASSPAHQQQFRLFRGVGQTLNTAAALPIPTAASPCLSPIRYSLDLSAIHQLQLHDKSTNLDDEPMESASQPHHRSLPTDDGSLKSVCLAQNVSTGRILTDLTTNTSIRSSFLRSPRHANVTGPVLGTPDYLSRRTFAFIRSPVHRCSSILGPEILMQDEDHSESSLVG